MRLENGLDRASFKYLKRLADGERRHMCQSYNTYDDYVVGVVDVLHRDYLSNPIASRCFLSSQELEIRNNFADAISCFFEILLLIVGKGHYEYLKWKIDNDSSSVDNPHRVVLLTCTLLKSTIGRLSHPPASSSITLLFKKKLISPESMFFWAPGDSTNHPLSTSPKLINLELSIWHWYLFYITSHFTGSLLEGGLLRRMPPHSPIQVQISVQISAQQRSHIGKALEAFLDHGADPYFVLYVSVTKNAERGEAVYHLKLDFEFGRKRVRLSIDIAGWTTKKASTFGRFPLNKSLKLTFREWIENLEFPNQDRLISLLERNERLEEEKLTQEAARESISHDIETSGNLPSENNKPPDMSAMEDEPVKSNKGGTITILAHISGQYAQITLLILGT
jgi:hypothetical protein